MTKNSVEGEHHDSGKRNTGYESFNLPALDATRAAIRANHKTQVECPGPVQFWDAPDSPNRNRPAGFRLALFPVPRFNPAEELVRARLSSCSGG